MINEFPTQEVHGFQSPGDYLRFVQYMADFVTKGIAEEVPPDPNYGAGKLFGGRWFRDTSTGMIWRLVPPDFPFKGVWEKVGDV
jgi:hypothetical protein